MLEQTVDVPLEVRFTERCVRLRRPIGADEDKGRLITNPITSPDCTAFVVDVCEDADTQILDEGEHGLLAILRGDTNELHVWILL